MKTKKEAMQDLARILRRKIIIQKKTTTTDEHDNEIEAWADWLTVRAERTSLWGSEYYAAAAIGQEQTVVFTLRYLPRLDEINTIDYRLLYDGKPYDIKLIDPLKDDGLWLKIRAIERREEDE